jgi:hypothetical protein
MRLPDPASVPQNPPPRPAEARSRRRKRGQLLLPHDAEGRLTLLSSLARRSYPTYELFVYAAVCGAVVGLGYVLDSQALLIFGILIAPLMLPWVGLLLATITGSMRFFFETLMALLVSAAIVFVIGALAGVASRPFMPRTFNESFIHSRLWWPDLVVLALGAIILTVSFVRSEAKPFLPSVMLAYEFFLPLGAGGFGLGSGVGQAWPHGLLVFLVHFAWACLFGLFTLAALRLMPTSAAAFMFSVSVGFALLVVLVVLMSGGVWNPAADSRANSPAQSAPLGTSPPPPSLPASTLGPSSTPIIETATPGQDTPTPEASLAPTVTPAAGAQTATAPAIEPTPIWAQVHAQKGGGAALRETPGGKPVTILDNFTFVQILPERQTVGGYTWAHAIAFQNGIRREGWIVLLYLETVTPAPGALPSGSSAVTATP